MSIVSNAPKKFITMSVLLRLLATTIGLVSTNNRERNDGKSVTCFLFFFFLKKYLLQGIHHHGLVHLSFSSHDHVLPVNWNTEAKCQFLRINIIVDSSNCIQSRDSLITLHSSDSSNVIQIRDTLTSIYSRDSSTTIHNRDSSIQRMPTI